MSAGCPRKHIEDLFETGLLSRITRQTAPVLHIFHQTEHRPDRVTISTHFKGEWISEMLLKFDFLKFGFQDGDQLFGSFLYEAPPNELIKSKFALLLQYLLKLFAATCGTKFIRQLQSVQLSKHLSEAFGRNKFVHLNLPLYFLLANLLIWRHLRLDLNLERVPVFVLDVRTWPKTLKFAVNHNTHLGTQRFCFLHRVSGEHNGRLLSESWNVRYDGPHESLGLRVHSSWRLIKEDDRWITNQGNGTHQLPLVASWELSRIYMFVILQIHLRNLFLNQLLAVVASHALNRCINF